MPKKALKTAEHEKIREWAEERGGRPAVFKGVARTVLHFDFEDDPDEDLERISWSEFFERFEERGLAMRYQEKNDAGETSRFYRFVDR